VKSAFQKPVVAAVIVGVISVTAWLLKERWEGTDAPGKHLYDEVGIIRNAEPFERTLLALFDESDVDVRIVFTKLANLSPEEAALQWMQKLNIGGRGRDARGVLFLYDVPGRRLRVEVGYGLEAYFPDAFVSYLMNDHIRDFFSAGDPSTGLGLTLRILHHRIRAAALGLDFDPRVIEKVRSRSNLSGGAGASSGVALGEGGTAFLHAKVDEVTRAYFSPQETPEATYQRYLEWLATAFDPSVTLFTPASRSYMAKLPVTKGYFDFILLTEYGRPYKIDTSGNLALLYFTNDPLVSPHFFRQREGKWEMDIVAEVRDTQETAGLYIWSYRGRDDDFSSAFRKTLINIGGYVRLADGDNRALPIRHSR
jgi:hypothetical protein